MTEPASSRVEVDVGRPFTAWSEPDSRRMAQVMHDATLERSRAGVSAMGTPFSPYAPSTVRRRKKKGLQVDRVDLTFTGTMFATMRVKATNYRATVYPSVKYGWWVNRLKPWIGFIEATMGPLDKQIKETVDANIKAANSPAQLFAGMEQ